MLFTESWLLNENEDNWLHEAMSRDKARKTRLWNIIRGKGDTL